MSLSYQALTGAARRQLPNTWNLVNEITIIVEINYTYWSVISFCSFITECERQSGISPPQKPLLENSGIQIHHVEFRSCLINTANFTDLRNLPCQSRCLFDCSWHSSSRVLNETNMIPQENMMQTTIHYVK